MNAVLWVYVLGYPFAVLVIMVSMERERRASTDPRVREAILRPALDGVVAGLVWPFILACALGLGVLWLLSRIGRALACEHERALRDPPHTGTTSARSHPLERTTGDETMTTLGQGQRWTIGPDHVAGPEVEEGQFYDVCPISELWEKDREIERLEAKLYRLRQAVRRTLEEALDD